MTEIPDNGRAYGAFSGDGRDHLDLVLAAAEIGIWELDVRTGMANRNQRHDQIFGYPDLLPHWSMERFLEHVDPADRDRVAGLQREAVAHGRQWSFETRITRADGSRRWISARGRPVFDAAGRTEKLIGHVIDITHIKEDEERLALLTDELKHRVNNTLALVMSMVNLSSRNARSTAALRDSLKARLTALARSHSLLIDRPRQDASLCELIETEIDPFRFVGERIDVDCTKDITIGAKVAEGLALAIHELLTNAIKHGALSNETGTLAIACKRYPDGSIVIDWREAGGPAVTEPENTGYGTLLLRTILGGRGQIETVYAGTGLRCTVTLGTRAAAG